MVNMMRRFVDFVKQKLRGSRPGKQTPRKDSKLDDSGPTTNIYQHTGTSAPTSPHAQAQVPLLQNQRIATTTTTTTTTSTLPVALVNRTSSSNVFVYITGLALNNNSAWFLLQSDGSTPYFPTSPSSTGSALQANVGIQLGAPGSTRTVHIPQLAGGRIFVSVDRPLTFLLNTGPALVEPSVTNQSDPNINVQWGFCEFTYSSSTLFANISYVDFVSVPVALSLTNTSGAVQTVRGLPSTGLDTICSNLQAQSNSDNVAGWQNLIVKTSGGANLRALSPNSSLSMRPGDFANYWEPYVNQVWQKYTTTPLTVRSFDNSIDSSGTVSTSNGQLTISGTGFNKPSTADIFSCNSGPFTTGADATRNRLIPQLAAAFNRTTLLTDSTTPAATKEFYQSATTNHYARIVHAANEDGKGYAFPYDDVSPADGVDQSGFVNDPNPQLLTVTFGGL